MFLKLDNYFLTNDLSYEGFTHNITEAGIFKPTSFNKETNTFHLKNIEGHFVCWTKTGFSELTSTKSKNSTTDIISQSFEYHPESTGFLSKTLNKALFKVQTGSFQIKCPVSERWFAFKIEDELLKLVSDLNDGGKAEYMRNTKEVKDIICSPDLVKEDEHGETFFDLDGKKIKRVTNNLKRDFQQISLYNNNKVVYTWAREKNNIEEIWYAYDIENDKNNQIQSRLSSYKTEEKVSREFERMKTKYLYNNAEPISNDRLASFAEKILLSGDMDKLKVLNPNIFYKEEGKSTLLELAIADKNVELVHVFLKNGALNKSESGNVLFYCLSRGTLELCILLVLYGFTYNSNIQINNIKELKAYYFENEHYRNVNGKLTKKSFDELVDVVKSVYI